MKLIAKEIVRKLLDFVQIEDSEEIDALIDKCIEAAVFTLPKTHAE